MGIKKNSFRLFIFALLFERKNGSAGAPSYCCQEYDTTSDRTPHNPQSERAASCSCLLLLLLLLRVMSTMAPSMNKRPAETQDPSDEESPAKRRAIEEDPVDKENDSRLNYENVASPRRQINPPGKPPEAGIIKQIYVENFMCHCKLRVDLCRNVNFINGQNGSGKSAVLAAIQICLGAGARRTHRARNLKELVRKDSASNAPTAAKIRVTLLNQGEDGYKHDVYGDSITVERSISLKGGYNGYKLLDHNGVERSRNKKDLDEMLDVL